MKLLKAFVGADRIGKVVHALQCARAPGITVSVVRSVGHDFVPRSTGPRVFPLLEDDLSRCPEVAKVEVVCSDEDINRLVAAVANAARTGGAGDGVVFVTPVDRAIKVRTGEEGAPAFSRREHREPSAREKVGFGGTVQSVHFLPHLPSA